MVHDGYYMHHGGGPGFFAWFSMILLTLLLVALIVSVATRFAGPRPHRWAAVAGPPRHDDPLEILRARYARGEIDREAFLAANADLGGPAPPGS